MEKIITIPQYILELKKKKKLTNFFYKKNVTHELLPLVDNSDIKKNFDLGKFFEGKSMENMLKKIKFLNLKEQTKIINEHKQSLLEMFKAIEDLDIEFLKKRFISYYIEDYILTAEKINQDIKIFQQAFAKNPEKFLNVQALIPLNFVKSINIVENATVICHTLSNLMTICALDISHEILIAKIASCKFDIKLLVSLYQNDFEIDSILSFYNKNLKKKTDFFLLNEEDWVFSEWDIQKEFFKLEVSKNFEQDGFFKHVKTKEFRKFIYKPIDIGLKVELFKKLLKCKNN